MGGSVGFVVGFGLAGVGVGFSVGTVVKPSW
jgi:hypothetical protein